MTGNDDDYEEMCRFCGLQKNSGKYIFSAEAVKVGLLSKIKSLFPDEIELINSETILPKFICDSCESTIGYFHEFRNRVKLVQQNLQKTTQEMICNKDDKAFQDKIPHVCVATEKFKALVVRVNSSASITCNNCNTKLHKDQVFAQVGKPSYCVCSVCGFKDDAKMFLCNKNYSFNCPKCAYLRKKRSQKENVDDMKKKYECSVCDKIFRCKGHLNRHCLIHFGSKPFSCEDCGASFNQKSSLQTHFLIHQQANPFSCKWCGQQFRHKQTLSNHVMSIHGIASEIDTLYECDKCKKKFVHKDKLKRHYRCHSGEKPFECELCNRTFTQKINLKTHYKKHESEGQFPHLCTTAMDTDDHCADNELSTMGSTVMNAVERNENHFTNLSRTVLDSTETSENQFATQSTLSVKQAEDEFPSMSQSVLNDTEKGKLIQELLGFDNIPAESTSLETFSSIVQNEYRRDENVILKSSPNPNDMYFSPAASACMIYSSNSVLYDLADVSETSVLPTFSSLNSVPQDL